MPVPDPYFVADPIYFPAGLRNNQRSRRTKITEPVMPENEYPADVVDLPYADDPELARIKMLPHSIEAEQSVLGGLLLAPDSWDAVAEVVAAGDFYRPDHRLIFRHMAKLAEVDEPIDPVTVAEALNTSGELEAAGGFAYLAELAKETPSAANIRAYAAVVRERSVLRHLIRVSQEIAESGYSPEGRGSHELIDEAERKIMQISEQGLKVGGPVELKPLLTRAVEHIDKLRESGRKITGLSTGYIELDDITSGLQPSDLVIVAGRPSMGKTSFAMNLVEHAVLKGDKAVLVFSMEMSADQLVMRMLSSIGRIDQTRIRNGRLEDDEWPRLRAAVSKIMDVPLYIDDTPALTPTEIRSRVRRIARKTGGLGMIMVDYLQLMRVAGFAEGRTAEISEISRGLKAIAKDFECPMVAVSQLNRALEQRPNKRPVNSDLRECVTGDTRVVLADGRPVPIRELAGRKPDLFALNGGRFYEVARGDRVWSVGRRPVRKVSLASGRSIRTTDEHLLLTERGWTECGNLRIGDRLAIAAKIPEPAQPLVWPDSRVALLGRTIGAGSREKRIPEAAFRLSDRQVGLLLKHLWATGGAVRAPAPGSTGSNAVRFSTDSPRLAEDVALLLQRLGIIARIRMTGKQGCRPAYLVMVSGAEMQRSFLEKVGAFGPEIARARRSEAALGSAVGGDTAHIAPAAVSGGATVGVREPGTVRAGTGGTGRFRFAPGRETPAERTAPPDGEEPRQARADDLFWDRVVDVGPAGEEEVFDLTVPGNANWIADGIVSHNSGAIEQDADLIMFIYRDEVYNEDSPDKGKAEIIIGKQRNGPIGVVKLAFIGQFTRFENLARDSYGRPA